jgi:NAD(P)-dependent dehydrogenase (short-subunit alcohol dehydrogenase family)
MGTMALDGMAALVTGGGSGLGLACARLLARDGAVVTIAARNADRLAAAADALNTELEVDRVRWVACDVTDEAAVEAAVAAARAPLGALHVAVANAGGGMAGSIFTTTLEVWRYVMDVNLTGPFLTIKHAGRAIVASGGGSIVATSSIAGVLTHRFMAPYCTSKAGLEMLVKVAADELGQVGVRVNAVRPGLVPTAMASVLSDDPRIVDDYVDQMPLGRLGTPEDVAAAVRWLVGPESAWVTGQCLAVDGGHTLRRGPRIEPMVEGLLGPDALSGLATPARRA